MTRALAAVFAAAISVAAAEACDLVPTGALYQRLQTEYGESPQGFSQVNAMLVVEMWGAGTNGTWTVLLTTIQGMSCIIGSGDRWREGMVPTGDPA